MSIVDLETFKKYVRDDAKGANDPLLQSYLDAASQGLNNGCARQWVVQTGAATARSFMPDGRSNVLPIDDCTEITSVVDNGTTLTVNVDFQAEPLNHLRYGETVPYWQLRKPWMPWYSANGLSSVVVTAKWGWAAIPYQITQACLTLAKELCNNQDVRLGIVAVTDAVAYGIRTNKVVRDAVDAYPHPRSIGIA